MVLSCDIDVELKAIDDTSRSEDLVQSLALTEEYIGGIEPDDLHSEEAQHFVCTMLPKIVKTVLGCSFVDIDTEQAACSFLGSVLSFIARTIQGNFRLEEPTVLQARELERAKKSAIEWAEF